MELVIDTSAIIAVIANEAVKPALIAATVGAQLVAPASLHWEVGNAFSAMRKRGKLTANQATAALRVYREVPVRLIEVPLEEAVAVAAEFDIYAYDAYFLVAAREFSCELLTLDRGLIHAAGRAGVAVRELNP